MEKSPIHAQVIDRFKNELLIVLVRRLGGKVSIPCNEIDATEGTALKFNIDAQRNFNFELVYKK